MDTLTQLERSEVMRRVLSKNTKPELRVRHLLYSLGFRYRLHCSDLPGTPDVVFRSRRKVIFVHGCFWHAHLGCPNNRIPKSHTEFWDSKISNNRRRDLRNISQLRRLGWGVQVIWECQIPNVSRVAKRVLKFLGDS